MEETMWKKLMRLNSQDILNKLCLYYGNFLPMEVRYHMASWIESTITKLLCVDPANLEYEHMTQQFQGDFVAEMMQRSQQMVTEDMIPTKSRFREAAKRFQFMNSVDLFSQLADIIRRECQLLYDFESGNYATYVSGSREIDGKIERLKESLSLFETNEVAKWKKSFFDYQEEYFMINGNNSPLNSSNGYSSSPSHPIEVNLHMSSLSCLLSLLRSLEPLLVEKLENIIHECNAVVDTLIEDYIKLWKYNQQKCGNNDFNINGADIEKLQSWCSDLGRILFSTKDACAVLREQQNHLQNDKGGLNNILLDQSQKINDLIIKLITGTVVVEQQPPQVIKTNTRFMTCVRLLTADALNNKITNALAKASIVSEMQARSMQNINNELSCGELANNQVNVEFNENNRRLVANFRNMLLKSFKRIGKKSCEMVTDEKFAIVFHVSMELCGGEQQQLKEHIISAPIVVIVHGSQEINAKATIVWDNAFAKIDRQLFSVPETVAWKDFADALTFKFMSATGRGLTAENLHFLAEKLFDHRVMFPVAENEHLVNWTSFCKERLPNRDFTFWEWFYAALKVTKDHLKNAFYEGRVIGFIDKKRTEELLYGSPHGTFILRFSDSELGGVSIAWSFNNVEVGGVREVPKVLHIQPINSKELEIIHLNQRLNDVDELTYLYPSTPKAEAFSIDDEPFSPSDYITFRTVMRVNINRRN